MADRVSLCFERSDAHAGRPLSVVVSPDRQTFSTRRPSVSAARVVSSSSLDSFSPPSMSTSASTMPGPPCFFCHVCCIDCGRPFSHLAYLFFDFVKSGIDPGLALDMLDINARCCRTHMISQHTFLFHPPTSKPRYDIGSSVYVAHVRDPPTSILAK